MCSLFQCMVSNWAGRPKNSLHLEKHQADVKTVVSQLQESLVNAHGEPLVLARYSFRLFTLFLIGGERERSKGYTSEGGSPKAWLLGPYKSLHGPSSPLPWGRRNGKDIYISPSRNRTYLLCDGRLPDSLSGVYLFQPTPATPTNKI